MNEEVLFRMGFNATAVQKGTASVLDQQKKAAMDYVSFWKKAIADKEAAEVAADTRAAQRSNRARQLWRQRADERKKAWKDELEAQRRASGANPEHRNIRGVNVANLARNVVGGARGLGGHGGISGGIAQEALVIARELGRGNLSAAVRSTSILVQRLGLLGKVASAVINPITGVAAGLAAGVVFNYKSQQYGRRILHEAGAANISTGGYQTILAQASRQGKEGVNAARAAIGNVAGMINSAQSGDTGGLQKMRKWGINISGINNTEDAWKAILEKLDATGNAARRAAMAQDLLGDQYEKFILTIKDGAKGFVDAKEKMKKYQPSTGQLAALSEMNFVEGIWGKTKQVFSSLKGTAMRGYAGWITNGWINKRTGLGDLMRATDQGAEIDAKIAAYNKIHPTKINIGMLKSINPEAAMAYREARFSQTESQAALDDRLKLGMGDMVSMARSMTGHIRPRLYHVTDRMRTAMKIDDIEARAQNAYLSGDDSGFKKLRSEADAMRKANPWMTFGDSHPTAKMEMQLEKANTSLDVVQKMAQLIIDADKGGSK